MPAAVSISTSRIESLVAVRKVSRHAATFVPQMAREASEVLQELVRGLVPTSTVGV